MERPRRWDLGSDPGPTRGMGGPWASLPHLPGPATPMRLASGPSGSGCCGPRPAVAAAPGSRAEQGTAACARVVGRCGLGRRGNPAGKRLQKQALVLRAGDADQMAAWPAHLGKRKCHSLHLGIFPLVILVLVFFGYGFLSPRSRPSEGPRAGPGVAAGKLIGQEVVTLSRMVYSQPKVLNPSRQDVLVLTPWLAPIVWEGTFNIDILNEQFRLRNTSIGLTVFAIKKYVVFLKLFLETAEQHFMVGHRVTYYVFTDRPADVPQVPLGANRQLVVLSVRNYTRWQDVSMHRMEMISRFSEQRFLHEVDYLVCADVDMKFQDHVGVEILSALFGTLHPGFYGSSRTAFTYERRPRSQAYIPRDEGDFYYMGAFFGGTVLEVSRLTRACHQAMVEDKANGIEAVWHDESHLNKYLLYHKPTKVLSPEYMWDQKLLGWPSVMKKLRYVAVPKNHQEIRNR